MPRLFAKEQRRRKGLPDGLKEKILKCNQQLLLNDSSILEDCSVKESPLLTEGKRRISVRSLIKKLGSIPSDSDDSETCNASPGNRLPLFKNVIDIKDLNIKVKLRSKPMSPAESQCITLSNRKVNLHNENNVPALHLHSSTPFKPNVILSYGFPVLSPINTNTPYEVPVRDDSSKACSGQSKSNKQLSPLLNPCVVLTRCNVSVASPITTNRCQKVVTPCVVPLQNDSLKVCSGQRKSNEQVTTSRGDLKSASKLDGSADISKRTRSTSRSRKLESGDSVEAGKQTTPGLKSTSQMVITRSASKLDKSSAEGNGTDKIQEKSVCRKSLFRAAALKTHCSGCDVDTRRKKRNSNLESVTRNSSGTDKFSDNVNVDIQISATGAQNECDENISSKKKKSNSAFQLSNSKKNISSKDVNAHHPILETAIQNECVVNKSRKESTSNSLLQKSNAPDNKSIHDVQGHRHIGETTRQNEDGGNKSWNGLSESIMTNMEKYPNRVNVDHQISEIATHNEGDENISSKKKKSNSVLQLSNSKKNISSEDVNAHHPILETAIQNECVANKSSSESTSNSLFQKSNAPDNKPIHDVDIGETTRQNVNVDHQISEISIQNEGEGSKSKSSGKYCSVLKEMDKLIDNIIKKTSTETNNANTTPAARLHQDVEFCTPKRVHSLSPTKVEKPQISQLKSENDPFNPLSAALSEMSGIKNRLSENKDYYSPKGVQSHNKQNKLDSLAEKLTLKKQLEEFNNSKLYAPIEPHEVLGYLETALQIFKSGNQHEVLEPVENTQLTNGASNHTTAKQGQGPSVNPTVSSDISKRQEMTFGGDQEIFKRPPTPTRMRSQNKNKQVPRISKGGARQTGCDEISMVNSDFGESSSRITQETGSTSRKRNTRNEDISAEETSPPKRRKLREKKAKEADAEVPIRRSTRNHVIRDNPLLITEIIYGSSLKILKDTNTVRKRRTTKYKKSIQHGGNLSLQPDTAHTSKRSSRVTSYSNNTDISNIQSSRDVSSSKDECNNENLSTSKRGRRMTRYSNNTNISNLQDHSHQSSRNVNSKLNAVGCSNENLSTSNRDNTRMMTRSHSNISISNVQDRSHQISQNASGSKTLRSSTQNYIITPPPGFGIEPIIESTETNMSSVDQDLQADAEQDQGEYSVAGVSNCSIRDSTDRPFGIQPYHGSTADVVQYSHGPKKLMCVKGDDNLRLSYGICDGKGLTEGLFEIKVNGFKAGQRLRNHDILFLVQKGSGQLQVDNLSPLPMNPGTSVLVKSGQYYMIRNSHKRFKLLLYFLKIRKCK